VVLRRLDSWSSQRDQADRRAAAGEAEGLTGADALSQQDRGQQHCGSRVERGEDAGHCEVGGAARQQRHRTGRTEETSGGAPCRRAPRGSRARQQPLVQRAGEDQREDGSDTLVGGNRPADSEIWASGTKRTPNPRPARPPSSSPPGRLLPSDRGPGRGTRTRCPQHYPARRAAPKRCLRSGRNRAATGRRPAERPRRRVGRRWRRSSGTHGARRGHQRSRLRRSRRRPSQPGGFRWTYVDPGRDAVRPEGPLGPSGTGPLRGDGMTVRWSGGVPGS
jgi:hypothetical protein